MADPASDILIVALTGGIASGKTLVADVLHSLGCYIESADRIAHSLMEPEGPVWMALKNKFGPGILAPDRRIDRKKLGELVFADDHHRRYVNRLIHPLVQKHKERTIETLRKQESVKIYVSEAALTIEAGYVHLYDRIVLVTCPPDLQMERLKTRNGFDSAEALRRIRSQMPAEEKRKFADYIVDNSGSLADTIEQTERVYRHLLRDQAMKCKFRTSSF